MCVDDTLILAKLCIATRPFNEIFGKMVLHRQVIFIHAQGKQNWITVIPRPMISYL